MQDAIRRRIAGAIAKAAPPKRKPKAPKPPHKPRVCADCGRRLAAKGRNAECRRCAAFTKRAKNRLDCAAYYRRVTGQGPAFCRAADIRAIFRAAAIRPAQPRRLHGRGYGPIY